MIVSYRDKRTQDFAAGKWVKAFSGFERSAQNQAGPAGRGDLGKRFAGSAGKFLRGIEGRSPRPVQHPN